ncbi:MAG: BTAD domain-containing putative transcriptional regulator [Gammaproteobacteria bacterium]
MSDWKDSTESRLPAKLNPPLQPKAVYRRKRLYRRIKQVLDSGAALWVQGPAGAGKTTLTSSFLQAENRPTLWYQLESVDGEPATLIRHLRTLFATVADAQVLPTFDPRLGQDPLRFAKEFFEAFFEYVPLQTVLVLDDYQDVEAAGRVDAVIAAALKVLPRDRHLIVLSRGDVPRALTRALADGRLDRLGWDELRLDDEEARHIAHLRVPRKRQIDIPVANLNRRAQGWVAGFVLMVQQAAAGGALGDPISSPTPDTVNDYFATELFGRGKGAELDLLMALSFFPRFSLQMAEAISDDPQAPKVVEDLYRRNFFLTRHESESGGIYFRLHPLFSDFLRHEAQRRLTDSTRRSLQLRAAQILAADGDTGDAVRLYQAAGEWPAAESLIIAEAPRRYQVGEFRAIQHWLAGLPAARIGSNAWLSLWRGACAAVTRSASGRADLQHAYALFRETNEQPGALLAWCMVVEGYVLEWGDMHPLDDWIAAFDDLEPVLARVPTSLGQRATFAMFSAMSYRSPWRGRCDEWARYTEEVFTQTSDPVMRAFMASQLAMFYAFSRGDFGRAAVFVTEIQGQVDHRFANPLAEIVFLVHYAAISLWNTGDVDACLEMVRKGIDVAERAGVMTMNFFLAAVGAWASITAGDYLEAESYLDRLSRTFDQGALLNRCVFHDTFAILNLRRGNLELARSQAEMSLELARRGGMPYAESACLLTNSRVYSLAGEWEEAERYRRLAAELANSMDNRFVFYHLLWFEAADRLQRDGVEAAIDPLRKALGEGRAGTFFANLWLERDTFSRLCHVALAHDLETDYVRRLIAGAGLPALDPGWANAGWPFRLRVEVLSGLRVQELTVDGYRPVSVQGRGAQLLEALVWSGGQGVSQERLADLLWPDAEGDAARRSFDTTLYRLRRAVGDERLLRLEGGRLSLDPGLAWTDAGALEAACKDLTHALQTGGAPTTVEALGRRLTEGASVMAANHPGRVGSKALDAGLRRKMERALDLVGHYWLARQNWELAVEAFESRLRLNPLAEGAYLELMRIHVGRGFPVEALSVYERCKENVKNLLGIGPGPEIENLYQRMRASAGDA